MLQLLTMQGGFPQALIGPDRGEPARAAASSSPEWTLAWPSGTRTEYHPIAAHWVIAELVETMSGRPYADVVNERVAARPAPPLCSDRSEDGAVVTIRTAGSVPSPASTSSQRSVAPTSCPTRPCRPNCC